ncbi:MAG: bifunctional lysylphosphatidylglycerol flippase/synthetase MprF [Rhodobacteraceae bacterium]|nr:bifunctional lysylphosphatidylglycerol flippase/synthetase MprF [Paracoccaceae bacterium]
MVWPIAAAAIMALAAFVIHRISGEVNLAQIRAAVLATPDSHIALALGLTLASYCGMALYDILAVRCVAPGKVPARVAAFAGMTGYALSNTLGFHLFVGGPVRYRIYASAGLDAADVGRVVGISFASVWLGIGALFGVALIFDPHGLPLLRDLSPLLDRLLGAAVLLSLVGLIAWLWRSRQRVSAFRWSMPLPSGPGALFLMIVGMLDISAAAGVLYVLLPADLTPGFAVFVAIFIVAVTAGSASHVPGGLGVLEATVLIGLGAGDRPDAFAALLLFRVIYYFLPLVLAGVALALFEGRRLQQPVLRVSRTALRTVRPFMARALAGLVFLSGVILLLSGNTPAEGTRMEELRNFFPLPFAETSHLLASLVGLLLLIIAHGLANRMALARVAAIALLLSSAAFSLLKGLDWEEAMALCLVAGLLYTSRDAFYRKGDWSSFRPGSGWLAVVAMTLICITLIGFFAFRNVEYRNELWWVFTWHGDAPRFLRATLALAVVFFALGIDALVNRPMQSRVGQVDVPDAVRKILTTCPATHPNIALLGDKRFMISEDGTAFLMYAVAGRSWITMGDPVGDAVAGADLVWRFAEMADRAGARAVFYAVTPESLPLYLDLGLAILKTGEVARVDLRTFTMKGKERQDSRSALSRATREGLEFSILPKAEVPANMDELREISDAWLALKSGEEKGFSLGRFDPDYLAEFDFAVLRREGRIVAFANLWRGAEKNEISVDLMRYRPDVSKVLMDALFAHLILYGQSEGYTWFNLGAAPLSGLADHPLASTWNRMGTFIYRRGDEFFNFEGLRAFKQKFGPVWTPVYLAAPGGLELPRALVDVAGLISGNPVGFLKR